MTGSIVRSASFTIADARYVGAKVGADLRILNSLYGKPSVGRIADFAEEVALLLNGGYLDTVDYGFRDAGENAWKLRLRYRATAGGLVLDSAPGRYPPNLEIDGLDFHSQLSYSSAFYNLTPAGRESYETGLPVQRTIGTPPTADSGSTTGGHGYGRNGSGVTRDVYIAN